MNRAQWRHTTDDRKGFHVTGHRRLQQWKQIVDSPAMDVAQGLAALAGGIFTMLIGAAVITAFLE